MKTKSQADILSAIIVVIITLGLISTAYLWAVPAIQKKLDAAIAERVYKSFDRNNVNSLPRKIEYIAAHGGEESFDAVTEGIWKLNETDNSIQFSFVGLALPSNITEGKVGGDWQLISGKNETTIGNLGEDNPLAVYVQVGRLGDRYNIEFKTKVVKLKADTKTYKFTLKPISENVLSSVWKTIKISRGDITQDQNSIETEIKILLV